MNKNHHAFQLWENGQLNEAVQLLFEEIDRNEENRDSYCNLASILILAKRYDDAHAVLETALKKYQNHADLLYTFGNLYYHKNNPIKALEYYNQVFNGNEKNLKNDATIMIGQCHLLLNEPKKAMVYLLTAYENDENDTSLNTLLGDCMMQTNHFKEAKNYFMKALEQSPDNDEVLFKRGLVGAALKEKPMIFNDFFEKSKKLNPEKFIKRLHQLKDSEAFVSSQQKSEQAPKKNELNDRKDE
ncbi:MAG: tetratricopeptide repeat protein [Carnobacterium sp.]